MKREFKVHLSEFYPHPVEKVWQALTDPTAISAWLMPCDFSPEIGHRFTIRGNASETWRGWTQCRVLELDPFKRMEWQWESTDLEEPTRVSFELEAVEGGTRLTLHHSGVSTSTDIKSLTQGWPEKFRQLGGWLSEQDMENRDDRI